MNRKIRWIAETAIMLALLVTLQALTKPAGQLVTGTCVNAVLAITALVTGFYGGITVAVNSPVLAFLLGIAPQALTVPAIMAGNAVYVVLLWCIAGKNSKNLLCQVLGWLVAAAAKFAVLYGMVNWVICGLFAQNLPAAALASFSWPQLVTALAGGAAALLMVPLLRKALRK